MAIASELWPAPPVSKKAYGAVAWPIKPIPDGVPIEFLRPTFNLLSVMFARLRIGRLCQVSGPTESWCEQ
jgi:hypothetical protein